MLTKRIIPCLDIKDGRTVKGTNFVHLKDAGDPVELAIQYCAEGADELVFLDITATNERRKTLATLVKQIAKHINIPFIVGGGIANVHDVAMLLNSGADKVSINTAAVLNPSLITTLAKQFGSQCIVVAIDVQLLGNTYKVATHGGRSSTSLYAVDWAKQVASMGAGEVLLTSMLADGTKHGFDIPITNTIAQAITIPVIASGGAGTVAHFTQLFTHTQAAAALAASIFHYKEISIPNLKKQLFNLNIPVRCTQ